MSELGDLLELMHGAANRFERVACEYRTWRHDERLHEAFVADAKARGATLYAVREESEERAPAEHEERMRLWLEKPDKVREEHLSGQRAGTYGVRVGEHWWMYDEHSGARTNDGDEKVGSGIGEALEALLDPAGLIALLDFDVSGQGERIGRDVVLATGRPRATTERHFGPGLHTIGSGADEYGLEVDAHTGVLLRVEARGKGEPFLIHEVVAIDFDSAMAPDTFVFEPPPGEPIQPLPWNRPFLSDIPIQEAVAKAPFPVLVPSRVPPEWQLTVSFHHASERPPTPPSVHLNYRAGDGTSGVFISQTFDHDEHFGFDLHGEEWQDVDAADGVRMRLRPRSDDWHQSQLALKRDGLAITMTSNDLSGEALVRLADSLVPAPSEPPAI